MNMWQKVEGGKVEGEGEVGWSMINCCASEMTIQIELVGAHTLGGKLKHIMWLLNGQWFRVSWMDVW